MTTSRTNVCECCWEVAKTWKHEHGWICSGCIDVLKEMNKKEVDNNE